MRPKKSSFLNGVRQAGKLLRVLIPSWQFFVQVQEVPALEYRLLASEAASPWRDAFGIPSRNLSRLFLNARGNFILAGHSAVERLLWDLSQGEELTLDEISQSTSYQVVEAFVAFQLRSQQNNLSLADVDCDRRGEAFEFRVRQAGHEIFRAAGKAF